MPQAAAISLTSRSHASARGRRQRPRATTASSSDASARLISAPNAISHAGKRLPTKPSLPPARVSATFMFRVVSFEFIANLPHPQHDTILDALNFGRNVFRGGETECRGVDSHGALTVKHQAEHAPLAVGLNQLRSVLPHDAFRIPLPLDLFCLSIRVDLPQFDFLVVLFKQFFARSPQPNEVQRVAFSDHAEIGPQ